MVINAFIIMFLVGNHAYHLMHHNGARWKNMVGGLLAGAIIGAIMGFFPMIGIAIIGIMIAIIFLMSLMIIFH